MITRLPPLPVGFLVRSVGTLAVTAPLFFGFAAEPTNALAPAAPSKNGADHWAFQPATRPAVPPVRDANWCRNPIDRFILARLETEQLSPAPETDRRTLLRRLSYDLTGLPPSPT